MTQRRRRWLTALGLFVATALGGIIAYLAARRRRKEKASPDEASVSDLLSRLRQEAASRESHRQRRPRLHLPRLGRRRPAASPPAESTEGVGEVPAAGEDTPSDT